MELNKETINHYRSEQIPLEKLKKLVLLNTPYLNEKPTWYYINDKLQYFKIRNDFRIFTELFFKMFVENIMDLKSISYKIACIRTKDPIVKSSKEKIQYGLISESFQSLQFNHYLASEIMNYNFSEFVTYTSGYSLKSFLDYFKQILPEEDYKKERLFLIKLFIADGFTFQVDRNPNNIAFQIPKIEGISYKDRLRISKIKNLPQAKEWLVEENGIYKLKGFEHNCIYDSERSLGVDHKNSKKFSPNHCWFPAFPYNNDLLFANGSQAKKVSEKEYEGYDPNLLSLYLEYPNICKPYFERLAYDDEYKKILEEFTHKASPVILSPKEIDYVNTVLTSRKKEFQKILKV